MTGTSISSSGAPAGGVRQKVVTGLVWLLVQNAGLKLITLAIFTVLARILDPSDLGAFAFVATVLGLAGIVVDQGLSEAVVQRREIWPSQLDALFVINLGIAVALTLGIGIAAPALTESVGLPEITPVLRVTSLGTLMSAMYFSQAGMLRRDFQYRWLTISQIVGATLSGALGIWLALEGGGVWSLTAQSLAQTAITGVLIWAVPQWQFRIPRDFRGTRELVSYGLSRLGANVLDFANSRVLDLLVLARLGPAIAGLYVVGVRPQVALMQVLSGAVLDVAHNGFSRLAANRSALLAAYYKSVSVSAAAAVPVFVVVAATAPELVEIVFGPSYATSATVLAPMCLLSAVQAMQFYNGTLFNALGRPSISLKLLMLKVAVTFITLGVVNGAGLDVFLKAYIGSQLATSPVSFYLVRRVVGVSLVAVLSCTWRFLLGSALAYGAVAGARSWLLAMGVGLWLRCLTLLIVASSVYAGFLALAARRQTLEIVGLFTGRSRQLT